MDDSVDPDLINNLDAPQIVIDEAQVKRLVLQLEKKINQNQILRLKFGNKPEKFMESEIDLDESLKSLHVISTAPDLYPQLVKLNAVSSILSLLSHENTDIVIDVIDLIYELTDPDTITETEAADSLINSLLENQGVQLLLETMLRLDPNDSSDSHGIYNTLGIIENLIEVQQQQIIQIIEKLEDKVLPWFSTQLQSTWSDIKLYCAEILAILLQNSEALRKKMGELNGIEVLLSEVAKYKKSDPETIEIEETIENIFDCICACLQTPENVDLFLKMEGIDLMLIIIKNKKFSRKNAIKVLDFAIMQPQSGPTASESFIQSLGLKTLFAAFMKKGSKKHKKGFSEDEDEEHLCSIVVNLFKNLQGSSLERLSAKFLEANCEKVDRLLEIHQKYANRMLQEEKNMKNGHSNFELSEEELYLKKLEMGLFTLQQADIIITFLCHQEFVTPPNAKVFQQHLVQSFKKENLAKNITDNVKTFINNLGETGNVKLYSNLLENFQALFPPS